MRILFAGTPELAVKSLEKLSSNNECFVLTAPDRIAGRGKKIVSPPVKKRAEELGLILLQPHRLGSEIRKKIRELNPDLLAVYAYGRLFGPKFIELFPLGGVNVHPSLLPRFRGPSPIPAAILSGDDMSGVTVQRIAMEMDAGNILFQEEIPLAGNETTVELTELASKTGADLLDKTVSGLKQGNIHDRPQDESKATYCRIVKKEDGNINWKLPAVFIERMIRAYTGWPGAYTLLRGRKLFILSGSVMDSAGNETLPAGTVIGIDKERGILIQTGDGILTVNRVQLQSKKPMDWKSFVNGVKELEGSMLGGEE